MINNVTLMGRLTATPELKATQSGKNVMNFSLAVERDYKVNNERVADFIECQAWGKTAEFIHNYFGKGDMLALSGSIEINKWKDQNGNNRYTTYVNASKVSFCGAKVETEPSTVVSTAPAESTPDFEEIEDDDLPF